MILPTMVYSLDQLTTLIWEIENGLSQLKNRSSSPPVFSAVTEEFLAINGIRTLNDATLRTVISTLESMKKDAKHLTISTGSMTTPEWRAQIIDWLRTEISPKLFCSFSTNTAQGGGVILRTPKNQYDLTFKHKILENADRLTEVLAK